jgi:hypothetical protein
MPDDTARSRLVLAVPPISSVAARLPAGHGAEKGGPGAIEGLVHARLRA